MKRMLLVDEAEYERLKKAAGYAEASAAYEPPERAYEKEPTTGRIARVDPKPHTSVSASSEHLAGDLDVVAEHTEGVRADNTPPGQLDFVEHEVKPKPKSHTPTALPPLQVPSNVEAKQLKKTRLKAKPKAKPKAELKTEPKQQVGGSRTGPIEATRRKHQDGVQPPVRSQQKAQREKRKYNCFGAPPGKRAKFIYVYKV